MSLFSLCILLLGSMDRALELERVGHIRPSYTSCYELKLTEYFSYLNDLDRITSPKYLPSDDDVLRARLKTVGVSEYRFQMEAGYESGTEWRIIDVGGSRSQRRKSAVAQRHAFRDKPLNH